MQISPQLRKLENGHSHWCPGCGEMHIIYDSWSFSGNYDSPSFTPSVKITGKQCVLDERGEWTGEWVLGPDGKALDLVCHYFVTNGKILFLGDCTHKLAGQTVDLPELPEWLRDNAVIDQPVLVDSQS